MILEGNCSFRVVDLGRAIRGASYLHQRTKRNILHYAAKIILKNLNQFQAKEKFTFLPLNRACEMHDPMINVAKNIYIYIHAKHESKSLNCTLHTFKSIHSTNHQAGIVSGSCIKCNVTVRLLRKINHSSTWKIKSTI